MLELDEVDGLVLDVDGWTSADDASESKPAPDLVAVALDKIDAHHPVMVGDATWDVVAASKLELETFAVTTGGISTAELRSAGASRVYASVAVLADDVRGRR